jgi:hypothetical protein
LPNLSVFCGRSCVARNRCAQHFRTAFLDVVRQEPERTNINIIVQIIDK